MASDPPKARPYQEELLMTAKEKNSLICLGTGAGKTYIAIMLISHRSHELEPPYDQDGKRTFFLVPTRPLVNQQADEIVRKSRFDKSDVGTYTGDMNVDFWSKEEWLEQLRAKKIFVMTRQIFLNMLNSAVIPLKKVNLLIFDEAHHAAPKIKKNKETKDCYKLIMDYILSRPESEHPHILGLSASLVNANNNVNTLKQTIADLEKTYKSTCTSVTDLDEVRKYATDPEECIWQFFDGTIGFECHEVLELLNSSQQLLDEMDKYKIALDQQNKKKQADESKNDEKKEVSTSIIVNLPIGVDAFKKCVSIIGLIFHSMGPWCAIEACDFYIQEFQSYIELHENSYPAFCNILISMNDMLKTVVGLIKYKFFSHQVSLNDMLLKFTSNKMKRLVDLLMNYNNQNENLAGIIFVKRRAICKALCKWLQKLKEIDADFEFLNIDYIVGEAVRPGFANKIAVKAAQLQKKTLIRFRGMEINLLVATSILEEGLDVSQCNLVVRYDGVDTYREWVQSQGRARSKNGRFVIFSEWANLSETKKILTGFKDTAKKLQIECQNVKKNRQPSTSYMQAIPEDEKPLIHPISGAIVTLDTAKAIVFMYCNRLPSDAFFTTNPYETIKESLDGFQCIIRLPINSPINEEIEGPVKETESKASKAAYLKVCRTLYEQDEINDCFVPYSKKARLKKIIEEFNLTCSIDKDDEYLSEGPKPGTVKRRQVYPKSFENMFADLPVKANASNCLYSIAVQPKTGVNSIGFICSQHVPLNNIVTSFPVYIKTAEFNISVTAIDTQFNLSPHQLYQVQSFHQVVFHESLGFKRKQLKVDKTSPVYVVPLNDKFTVDWDMIQLTLDRNDNNITSKHDGKQKEFIFNEIDYTDALVYRWYDPVGLFEVLEVKKSKTSCSPFPDNNSGFKTYTDYYIEKYGLQIIHTKNPLLSVDSIGFNSSVKRLEQTTAERKRKPIDLVPELVTIFPIATSFHRQCRLLPAIFYRLCQVYNVERLRERIACEANIGLKSLPPNHSWGILNFKCDKSNCRDANVNKENQEIIDTDSDSEYDSGDYDQSVVGVKDSNEMETESTVLESSRHYNLEVVPPTQNVFKRADGTADMFTTKQNISESRNGKVAHMSSDIYGDTNELARKYSNFNVAAYAYNMKESLFKQYEKLLQAPLYNCDLGDHSQYSPKNSATRTTASIDFSRVKSFDVHYDQHIIGPTPSLLLTALTTRKAIDTFNMERLETLGDSFLKLTTSGYFYYKLPVLNEGYLSSLKVNQISNRNLYRLGKSKHLAEYIVAHQFQPSNSWLPPGFCVDTENCALEKKKVKHDGESFNKFIHQEIGDKSIADCCEALIGAYLLTSGPKGAVKFMTWLGIRITDPIEIENNDHWLPLPRPGQSTSSIVDSEIKIKNLSSTLTGFEEHINYKFRDKCFLIQAMTHVSYHDNTVTDCYQRLEFLGDAVLDYIVTRYIYEDPQQFTPGDLTDLRAALTNNSFFGSLAVKHNFHVHLKINSYELYRSIHSFADKFKKNGTDIVYGNFMQLLDEREAKSLDETDVPKALGDVFEAVAGAVYLDSNYSLDAVWRVYYPLMKIELDEFRKNIPKSPLSLLYIKFPKSVIFSKAAIVNKNQVSVTVTIKHKSGTFTADGFGKNRYWAKNSAAKRALTRKI